MVGKLNVNKCNPCSWNTLIRIFSFFVGMGNANVGQPTSTTVETWIFSNNWSCWQHVMATSFFMHSPPWIYFMSWWQISNIAAILKHNLIHHPMGGWIFSDNWSWGQHVMATHANVCVLIKYWGVSTVQTNSKSSKLSFGYFVF